MPLAGGVPVPLLQACPAACYYGVKHEYNPAPVHSSGCMGLSRSSTQSRLYGVTQIQYTVQAVWDDPTPAHSPGCMRWYILPPLAMLLHWRNFVSFEMSLSQEVILPDRGKDSAQHPTVDRAVSSQSFRQPPDVHSTSSYSLSLLSYMVTAMTWSLFSTWPLGHRGPQQTFL